MAYLSYNNLYGKGEQFITHSKMGWWKRARIKIYSSKQKEMINIAKKDFEICNTVTQYNEFINKYERYYDNEAEIQSLINKAFYELRSLKTVGDSSWYIDNTDWIRFSEKHPNAKNIMKNETN